MHAEPHRTESKLVSRAETATEGESSAPGRSIEPKTPLPACLIRLTWWQIIKLFTQRVPGICRPL